MPSTPARAVTGLDELSETWLSRKPATLKDVAGSGRSALAFEALALDAATAYAAEQAETILRLAHVLKPRLASEELTTVYERLERPLISVLARMEARGISIDRQILSRLSGEFAQGMARLEAAIHETAGESFNIGSPKQLGDILFGKMGFQGAKKTPSGAWATGAQILEELAAQGHELPRLILDWRQISKLKINLYRCAADLCKPPDEARSYLLLARLDDDRAAFLDRAQYPEYSDPYRGRPQDQDGLHCGTRQGAGLCRLQPDRTQDSSAYGGDPATAQSVRGWHRHSCDDGVRDV